MRNAVRIASWVVLSAALLSAPTARADTRVTSWTRDGTAVHYLAGGGEGAMYYTLDLRTGVSREMPEAAADDSEEVKSSPTSPDGKARIEFSLAQNTDPGAWSKGGKVWERVPSQTDYTITREGKVVSTGRLETSGINVTPYWSPDSKRVVLVVTTRVAMFRDSGKAEVLVKSAVGPRLVLMAQKDLLGTAGPRVADALEKAGFVPTRLEPARDLHPISSVYAAKGYEALAQQIAAAVPGGAKVEALDWKADADVLVAVGASAR